MCYITPLFLVPMSNIINLNGSLLILFLLDTWGDVLQKYYIDRYACHQEKSYEKILWRWLKQGRVSEAITQPKYNTSSVANASHAAEAEQDVATVLGASDWTDHDASSDHNRPQWTSPSRWSILSPHNFSGFLDGCTPSWHPDSPWMRGNSTKNASDRGLDGAGRHFVVHNNRYRHHNT